MKRLFLLVALLIASSFTALAQPAKNDYRNINLVDTLEAAGNFKTLLTALHKTGLIDTLRGPGPFTIFAPNDEAFAKLPPGTLDALMQDPVKLRALLLYHVTAGKFTVKELQSRTDKSITMMGNTKAEIQCNGLSPASSQSKAKMLCNGAPLVGEQIVMAAIRQPDGKIVQGKNHPQILLDMGKSVPEDRSGPEYGFVTTTGRFVSREEAAKIAGVPNTIKEGSLYTQDLDAARKSKEPGSQSKARLQCDDNPANSKAKLQCNESPANSKARLLCDESSAAPIVINKSARVVMADLSASNGMIHVIDSVLMPTGP